MKSKQGYNIIEVLEERRWGLRLASSPGVLGCLDVWMLGCLDAGSGLDRVGSSAASAQTLGIS